MTFILKENNIWAKMPLESALHRLRALVGQRRLPSTEQSVAQLRTAANKAELDYQRAQADTQWFRDNAHAAVVEAYRADQPLREAREAYEAARLSELKGAINAQNLVVCAADTIPKVHDLHTYTATTPKEKLGIYAPEDTYLLFVADGETHDGIFHSKVRTAGIFLPYINKPHELWTLCKDHPLPPDVLENYPFEKALEAGRNEKGLWKHPFASKVRLEKDQYLTDQGTPIPWKGSPSQSRALTNCFNQGLYAYFGVKSPGLSNDQGFYSWFESTFLRAK